MSALSGSVVPHNDLAYLQALKAGLAQDLADQARFEASLAEFARAAWAVIEPGTPLLWNWHLNTICGYLEALAARRIKRLIVNVPPGSMKSILVSVMFPAWTWATRPDQRFLAFSAGQDLALRDSGRMRLLLASDWFRRYWTVEMLKNQDEKSLYQNSAMGFRQSLGVTGNIIGKRGDVLLLDDLLDAKMAYSEVERNGVNLTYDQSISNRINSEDSAIVLIMQRLHTKDLTGHLLAKTKTKWTHLRITQEYEGRTFDAGKDIGRPELDDPRTKHGELMFPQRFSPAWVAQEKEDKGEYGFAGQHQQRPIPLGGGLLKADWWKTWPKGKPLPQIEHIFTSWDTAYSEKDMESNAHSAMTMWGIWWNQEAKRYELLLMRAWHGQVDYPDLLEQVLETGRNELVNCQLIEKKASGISIVQSLKKAIHEANGKPGVWIAPVKTYQPDRDKVSRAYAVQDMLRKGMIWRLDKAWAEAVVGHVASFPNGMPPSADLTDTCTQAWLYLKHGWWLQDRESGDDKAPLNDEDYDKPTKKRGFYG